MTKEYLNRIKKFDSLITTEFSITSLEEKMIFTASIMLIENFTSEKELFTSKEQFMSDIALNLTKFKGENKEAIIILIEEVKDIEISPDISKQNIEDLFELVHELITLFNSKYTGHDLMGEIFNQFRKDDKKSNLGQVFTPQHISDFMYDLLEIKSDETILDSASGTGALLLNSLAHNKNSNNTLIGMEYDKYVYLFAVVNMLISKNKSALMKWSDSSKKENFSYLSDKNIDKVLMNPPYELKYHSVEIVENTLDSLKKGTKVAIILPSFRFERIIKAQKVLKNHKIDTIVRMPKSSFNADILTSIFVFTAGVPQENNEIYAYDLSFFEADKDNWYEAKENSLKDIKNKIITSHSKILAPKKDLSYKDPLPEFSLTHDDINQTVLDYAAYTNSIGKKKNKLDIENKSIINSKNWKEVKVTDLFNIKRARGNDLLSKNQSRFLIVIFNPTIKTLFIAFTKPFIFFFKKLKKIKFFLFYI